MEWNIADERRENQQNAWRRILVFAENVARKKVYSKQNIKLICSAAAAPICKYKLI